MPNYDSSKKNLKIKAITTLSILGLFITAFANLISTNMLSTRGVEVNKSEIEILKIEKENHLLQVKIEEASRLNDLEEIANQQGFVTTSNIVFVPTPGTVALR